MSSFWEFHVILIHVTEELMKRLYITTYGSIGRARKVCVSVHQPDLINLSRVASRIITTVEKG